MLMRHTCVGNVGRPHHPPDLFHALQIRAQTAVHGEDLLVDDSGDRKAVETVRKCLPQLNVIAALALVVESIDLGDLARFVVPAKDGHSVSVAQLEGNQQGHGFDGIVSSVYVVSHEQVVGIWRIATDAKEFCEVVLQE